MLETARTKDICVCGRKCSKKGKLKHLRETCKVRLAMQVGKQQKEDASEGSDPCISLRM